MRAVWRNRAIDDLENLASRAPSQAAAVVAAVEWLAAMERAGVGRVVGAYGLRYWPVPPQGIYYYPRGDDLIVARIRDARRRRIPW